MGRMNRCIIEEKGENKRERRRALTLLASDLVQLVGWGLADSVYQAVRREWWYALEKANSNALCANCWLGEVA